MRREIEENKKFTLRDINYIEASYKNLDDKDIEDLIKILQIRPKVSKLTLDHANINDKQIIKLVDSKVLNQINYLDLWSNNITDRGASVLAQHFKHTSIYSLNLSHNPMSKSGLKTIADHLKDSNISCVVLERILSEKEPEVIDSFITALNNSFILQYVIGIEGREDFIKLEKNNRVKLSELIANMKDKETIDTLDRETIISYQLIFGNLFLKPNLNGLDKITCNKINNHINDNYLKITGVIKNNMEIDYATNETTIHDLSPCMLGEIFQYCKISDVIG